MSIAAGDVTGNGLADLLVAAENANAVMLFEGASDGTFSAASTLESVNDARAVAMADVDGDGALDAVYTSAADATAAYRLSTGGGSFDPQVLMPSSAMTGACALAVGDLNGAAGADIAVAAGGSSEIYWFPNTASPPGATFATTEGPIDGSAAGADTCALVTVDVNGDGARDLVLGGTSALVMWLNDGAGVFGAPVTVYTGSVHALVAGDLDADGDQDLVVGSGDAAVHVLVNTGDGNFTAVTLPLTFAEDASALALGDWDNDGKEDIIVGSFAPSRIGFFATINATTYKPYRDIYTLADGIASIAVFNNDGGRVDLASASTNDDTVAVYNNTVLSPQFASAREITTTANGIYSVASADIDGDGDVDVLMATEFASEISWSSNVDGAGTFALASTIATGVEAARDVDAADLDSDGDIDVVSVSSGDNTLAWYPNLDGRGAFSTKYVVSDALMGARTVAIADINDDSHLDLVCASSSDNSVRVFYWMGFASAPASGFSGAFLVDSGLSGAIAVGTARVNNDATIDVVAAGRFANLVVWYPTLANMTAWGSAVTVGAASSPRALAVGDINGDGRADVAVAASSGNHITWFSNDNAAGTAWTEHALSTVMNGARDVVIADLDGDGRVDVAGASLFNDIVGVWMNTDGAGTFDAMMVVDGAFDGANSLSAADVDGDGDVDLVAGANQVDTVAWFRFLTRTAAHTYAAVERNVTVAFDALRPAWWDCHRASARCLMAHAGASSRCVTDTLLLEDGATFGVCLQDSHARLSHALAVKARSGRAGIDCAGTGVLMDIQPHPLTSVPLVGSLALHGIDISGMRIAFETSDGAPGLRVTGDGALLALHNATVTDCASEAQARSSRAADLGTGGAVLASAGGAVRLVNTTMSGNRASVAGGAIAVRDAGSGLSVSASRLTGCSAGSGGAVHVSADAGAWITASRVDGNMASGAGGGGGLRALSGTSVAVSSSWLTGNTATGPGGALMADATSEVTVTATLVADNSARFGGGVAVVAAAPLLTLESAASSADIGMAAAGSGGAVNTTLVDVTMRGNLGGRYGGAVFSCGGMVSIGNASQPVQWSGNRLTRQGTVSGDVFVCGVEGSSVGAFSRDSPDAIPWLAFSSPAVFAALSEIHINGPVAQLRWFQEPEEVLPVGFSLDGLVVGEDLLGQDVADALVAVEVAFDADARFVERGLSLGGLVGVPSELPSASLRMLETAVEANTTFAVTVPWALRVPSAIPDGVAVAPLAMQARVTGCPAGSGGVVEPDTQGGDVALSFCRACPEESYSVTNGSLNPCEPEIPCTGNARQISGVVGPARCVCKQGFMLDRVDAERGRICVACPTGAVCAEGVSDPLPAPNYFRVARDKFVRCRRADACLGGTEGCATGYTGYMCNSCASGYYSKAASCLACPAGGKSVAANLALTAVVLAGLGAAGMTLFPMYKAGKARHHAQQQTDFDPSKEEQRSRLIPATISMGLFAFQVVGLISETKAGWQGQAKDGTEAFTVFNLDMSVTALGCDVEDPYALYALNLFLPLMLYVVALSVMFIGRLLQRQANFLKLAFNGMGYKALFDTVLVSVSPLLHIPLSRAALLLYDCIQLPDGTWVLDADPGVKCFSKGWWSVAPIGFVVTLVCVLGLPTYFFLILYQHRDRLFLEPTFSRLSGLYKTFREPFYMFSVVAMARRLMMVIVITFAGEQPLVQLALLLAIMMSQLISSLEAEPYFYLSYNNTEARLSGLLIALVVTAGGAYAERGSKGSVITAIDVITIAILIAIPLVALYGLLEEIWQIVHEKKGEFSAANERAHRIEVILSKEVMDLEPVVARQFSDAIAFSRRFRNESVPNDVDMDDLNSQIFV